MRAIGVTQFGGPDALEVLDLPEPHAGAGEVRIRVHAATVNPTDTGLRSGAYGDRPGDHDAPWIPGMDAAGVLDEVGEGVEGWAVGDRVAALVLPTGPHGGAYAEELVVPAASIARLPGEATDDDLVAWSTLLMNAMTARLAIESFDLPAGATIAVTGAAGSFGGYVVQLAKVDGLVVVADASEADHPLVRSFGADVVLERGAGWVDAVLDRYPGGVDGFADGALLGAEGARVVRDGGVVSTVRGYRGEDDALARSVRFEPVFVRDYGQNTEALDLLRQQAERGEVTLRVADTLPAAEAAAAHTRLEAGGVRGRLVLLF
jgi:NADPH:quinone reductase-like Zn-dependent oxidoreductase